MKMQTYFIALFTFLFTLPVLAQKKNVTEDIKVWGNCGMCKSTIEKAAKAAGATAADWSEETKLLSVSYNTKKTSNQDIQKAIAGVGYDTKDFTAPDDVYNKLHGCCKYERKAEATPQQMAVMNHGMAPQGKCCDKAAAGKSMPCTMDGKAMDCCKDGKTMDCCKDGVCDKSKKMDCCKDGKCTAGKQPATAMAACKEKGCCKS